MFGRNHFDAADLDSEADGDSNTNSLFSDSSSDDSDSDLDSDYKHKHHKYSHKKKTKKYTKTKRTASITPNNNANGAEVHSLLRSSSPAQLNNDGEVEDIICRLQNMSLSHPTYAALYYQAFKLDKDIVHIIQPQKDAATSPYSRPTNSTFSQFWIFLNDLLWVWRTRTPYE